MHAYDVKEVTGTLKKKTKDRKAKEKKALMQHSLMAALKRTCRHLGWSNDAGCMRSTGLKYYAARVVFKRKSFPWSCGQLGHCKCAQTTEALLPIAARLLAPACLIRISTWGGLIFLSDRFMVIT